MKKRVMANFVQDDTKTIQIRYSPPVDLTGVTFRVTLKASPAKDAPAVLNVSHTAGAHPDDLPAQGLIHITIDGAATSAVPAGTYYGSIKRTLPTGETATLIQSGIDGAEMVVCYPTLWDTVP